MQLSVIQRDPMYPLPSFPRWYYLAKVKYKITTRKLTMMQSINPSILLVSLSFFKSGKDLLGSLLVTVN